MLPRLSAHNERNILDANMIEISQVFQPILFSCMQGADFEDLGLSQLRVSIVFAATMTRTMSAMRNIGQIARAIVSGIAVYVMHMMPRGIRAKKSKGNDLVNVDNPTARALPKADHQMAFPRVRSRMQDALLDVPPLNIGTAQALYPAKARYFIKALVAGDWLPDFVRGRIGAHGEPPLRCVMPRDVPASPRLYRAQSIA
jgi:hypothetical protein